MNKLLSIALLALFTACTTPVSQKGNSVSVTDETPKGCKFLGYVSAQEKSVTFSSPARESARNVLINKAADMGADLLSIPKPCDGIYSSSCNGKAYKCKK